MARLDSICRINMGASPDSSTYNDKMEGLPFYQGNADFGEKHPTPRVWCNAPTKIAQKDDVLISVRAPIGALNIATEQCCIGRGLAALTVNTEICDTAYLWYGIKSKVDELNAKGTGSTFKAISRKALEETDIPLPDLPTQRRIAATLDKVSEGIAVCRQMLADLDVMVKSQFVEMFGDIIENTKQWPVYKLEEIASSRLGKMLDAKKQTGEFKFPYLANTNVQWFRFDLTELRQMDFDPEDQIEFELQDGDLMVCEGGEVGRCAVWHKEITPCFFQKAIHRVRCKSEYILPEYLAFWFKHHSDFNAFEDVVGSITTIAHLPGVKLKNLNVVVPPIDLQAQFVALLDQADKSKFVVQQQLAELETLKKNLMQEYFG